jgi:hypothetical protein
VSGWTAPVRVWAPQQVTQWSAALLGVHQWDCISYQLTDIAKAVDMHVVMRSSAPLWPSDSRQTVTQRRAVTIARQAALLDRLDMIVTLEGSVSAPTSVFDADGPADGGQRLHTASDRHPGNQSDATMRKGR